MFADPTVAIEPPPQPQDFDLSEWAKIQRALSDPFGVGGTDYMFPDDGGSSTPAPAPTKGWTDVFTDVGKSFASALGGSLGNKIGGQTAAAHLAAQQQKSDQTLLWVVGGVGVAVVLGALVLRGGKR